ncbi:MAG: hypothetical protein M1829_002565 [Trizodia sp. TS-e1964]|nr:MAG: hypothetical protein M1829_002565 [Trizodia sp. TS-e1964]
MSELPSQDLQDLGLGVGLVRRLQRDVGEVLASFSIIQKAKRDSPFSSYHKSLRDGKLDSNLTLNPAMENTTEMEKEIKLLWNQSHTENEPNQSFSELDIAYKEEQTSL